MKKNNPRFLDDVAEYYSRKLQVHGDTPLGVDWNGEESQRVRFDQLCKLIDFGADFFSLNDFGCGYGALLEYLQKRHANFAYLGLDISLEMIKVAKKRQGLDRRVRFVASSQPHETADYSVASGVFNVRLGSSDEEWENYLETTLDILDKTSVRGFAFNCLTLYSDEDKRRDYLYYADPGRLFALCKRRYSSQVALLHDYGLYEFTLLVRKLL